MRLRTWISVWCMVALTAGAAYAQDITITAEVSPQRVAVGQQIRLQVTIEGKANVQGAPALPPLPEFQVYGGGRSSNFSFVNGQISSSLNFTYVLVPKQEGDFTIGPVTLTHNGQTYATQPIAVSVVSGATSAAPSAPSTGGTLPRQAPPAGARQAEEAVFITTSTDRHRVFVNEPVTLTFRFFSRLPILSQPQYTPPDTSGFWSEDLPPQKEYITTLNGQEYRVIEINTVLFPTTSGPLTIGPAQLMVQVRNFQRQSIDPFADDFFRDFFSTGQQVALRSKPIAVEVLPIPEQGKPANYSGTVGQWSLSAKLDRKEAKAGEAVTLEIRIFGEGNVKSVGKPDLPALAGFKVYETVSSSEVQKQNGRIRGVKIYRTLIRPEVTGDLNIPPISYSYFDPTQKKYEQVSVPSLSLRVLPGETVSSRLADFAGPRPSAALADGVKVMTKDIRYLKLDVPLTPSVPEWPRVVWLVGFGIPPLALVLVWAWQRRQDHLAADPRLARRLQADRTARRTLHQANLARRHRDPKAFYTALAQALTHYLADQLGLSRAGVTQREILHRLNEFGADQPTLDQLTALFDESDFSRFAPGSGNEAAMEAHERQAEELLSRLIRLLTKEKRA